MHVLHNKLLRNSERAENMQEYTLNSLMYVVESAIKRVSIFLDAWKLMLTLRRSHIL